MPVEDIEKEYMRSGHMACPGCGVAATMRLVLKVLGEKTIVVIIPSCVGVISAAYPNSTLTVPCFHSAFEIAAPTAAGIACALKIRGKRTPRSWPLPEMAGLSTLGSNPFREPPTGMMTSSMSAWTTRPT